MSFEDVWMGLPERITCKQLLQAIGKGERFVTAGVLQQVQSSLFGVSKWICIEDCKNTTPSAIWATTCKLLDAMPPPCPQLKSIVDSDGSVSCVSQCLDVLRDIGKPFEVLCKLPTAELRLLLTDSGLSENDANAVALGVYKMKRRQTTNAVEQLTDVERGVRQLAAKDEKVSFAHCRLDATAFEALSSDVAANDAIKVLDLSGNNIHQLGAQTVALVISKLPKLEALMMCGNHLLRAGCERVLAAAVPLACLQTLDLSCCRGGPQLWASLSVLEGKASITQLILSGNDLTCVAAMPTLPNLRLLDVSSNRVGTAGVASIAACIKSPLLQKLNLSNNVINDAGVASIAAFAREQTQLRSIDLSFNPIHDEGTNVMLKLVQENVVSNVAMQHTNASQQMLLALEADVTRQLEARKNHLVTLRTVPIRQWSVADVASVAEACIFDTLTLCKVLGMDGNALSTARDEPRFTPHDWKRLLQFQS